MTRAPAGRRPARKKASPTKRRGDTPPMTKRNMQVRVVSLTVLIAAAFVVLGGARAADSAATDPNRPGSPASR
jgi:hypothetical protein